MIENKDEIPSSSARWFQSVSKFAEVVLVQEMSCLDCHVIEWNYNGCIKNRSAIFEKCSFRCNSGLQRAVNTENACKSAKRTPHAHSIIIKSLIMKLYNNLTSTSRRITTTTKLMLSNSRSMNRMQYRKSTVTNDMYSREFHRACVKSVSERLVGSSNESNPNNGRISLENNRMSYRSNIISSNSGSMVAAQIYGNLIQYVLLILLSLSQVCWTQALLVEPKHAGLAEDDFISDGTNYPYVNISNVDGTSNRVGMKSMTTVVGGDVGTGIVGSPPIDIISYMDKMNNLERSVAAVLIKVAYGTTSTTKRSIPDSSYVSSLTTIATPLLTTLRYPEKFAREEEINIHHRNYELDLERDHALPTSAPNADILKSNSNPTYPNPNRYHNYERDRQRNSSNSTSVPTLPNVFKKSNNQPPTIPMHLGDIPIYSPPARSFFTPPLPPEYQNPFADKPTLRGTNNDGVIANTGSYINRRPIPPPSLMPGHERIPYRPPDLAPFTGDSNSQYGSEIVLSTSDRSSATSLPINTSADTDFKKVLNTPFQSNTSHVYVKHLTSNSSGVTASKYNTLDDSYGSSISQALPTLSNDYPQKHKDGNEVLPSIRRILSGSNGNKGDIPEVLLRQVTSRPMVTYITTSSSPAVMLDSGYSVQVGNTGDSSISTSSNINKSKYAPAAPNSDVLRTLDIPRSESIDNQFSKKSYNTDNGVAYAVSPTLLNTAEVGVDKGVSSATFLSTTTTSTISNLAVSKNSTLSVTSVAGNVENSTASSTSSSTANSASHSAWAVAWNVHVYFSVVLFTILAVYSLYKVLTFNKLAHLFSQSYFMCIHMILILICSSRIFYLCYDPYNIHSTFNLFISELLLNLPATLLTISFSVLILYLFLKALNHKNNRYSALIRPLTVIVGCSVHVVLCITLHYVESYTLQNQLQQQLLYQQQQILYRRQLQHLHQQREVATVVETKFVTPAIVNIAYSSLLLQSTTGTIPNVIIGPSPPRVLSLLCQIIYIFVCLFLGLLYLYLYRVLKKILRTKSQNYIHGYQNLSYAIHITIATALLFVLLAALQVFGAISISTTRPLIQQLSAEIDWLQWGYQFSLRLIEIAIIILLSWVAGLETSSGNGGIGSTATSLSNGDPHYGVSRENGGGSALFGSGTTNHNPEKHQFHYNHSNMAGFFLPCTSSSSQEQFETDYPAVCNANTNIHTYTMRTGKLIYDDGFALNSLSGNGQPRLTNAAHMASTSSSGSINNGVDCQKKAETCYQRPFDSGSVHSDMPDHNMVQFGVQTSMAGGGCARYKHETAESADYFTDATTDHYENPNFDLHCSVTGTSCTMDRGDPKLTKTSTTSTTASSSGGSGSSVVSQQQILLLQSDSCYSEPLSQNTKSCYNLNNFERVLDGGGDSKLMDYWLENRRGPVVTIIDSHKSKRSKKVRTTLERNAYGDLERLSSKCPNFCANHCDENSSFDRDLYYDIRKSGTLQNISVGGDGGGDRNSSSSSAGSSNLVQRAKGSRTLTYQQRLQKLPKCANSTSIELTRDDDHRHEHSARSSLDTSLEKSQQQRQQQNFNDAMMLSGTNVKCTKISGNEDGSCMYNSNTTTFCESCSRLNETNAENNSTAAHTLKKTYFKNATHSNALMLLKHFHSQPQDQKDTEVVLTFNPSLGPFGSSESNSSNSSISATSSITFESGNNHGLEVALDMKIV